MLYFNYAEIGIIGALSAIDPATNFLISSCCLYAASCSLIMISILFYRIMICCSFMISTAAKCSEVYGWGHG